MSTIKIKNKFVTYSEELTGNTYKLIFEYIKPANAHYDAQKIQGEANIYINLEDRRDSNGVKRVLKADSSLHINGNYVITRSYISDYKGLQIGLSVSEYEYNSINSKITKSDAQMIYEIFAKITLLSELFTINNLTHRAEANDILNEMDKAEKLIGTKCAELEEAKTNFAQLLIKYNFSNGEFLTFRGFVDEGLPVDEALKAARILEKDMVK